MGVNAKVKMKKEKITKLCVLSVSAVKRILKVEKP